jgi:nucleoside-diphosphate-sugar epimerase
MTRHYLVTGGAGFIGSNYAHRLIRRGERVTLFDNLSRAGAPRNIAWLRDQFGDNGFRLVVGDLRSADLLTESTRDADVIVHLAGQVAVTTSVANPRGDFEANALGTFNALEAARLSGRDPIFLYASTNKVYGGMENVRLIEEPTRWLYADLEHGCPETQPLDFHSPYGVSKGSGDQYTRDYSRIYGLRSVVFRQSCIAGSQEIVTPFGKKPISQLEVGDLIHSGWGWRRVKHVWQTGVKPVRRLTTMQGLSVSLTADHRVIRPHGLFANRDLAYGDFLAVLPEALHTPCWRPVQDQALDADDYVEKIKHRTKDQRCWNEAKRIAANLLPLTNDKLMALTELVGWLFGDGHLAIHHRQSREAPAYSVQFFGSEAELAEISQRMGWLGLPISGIIRWHARSELPSGHVVDGHSARIQQQSIPVFTLFESLGVPVGDKARVEYSLPEWIQNGDPLVQRAFLRGFFGAELGRVQADSYLAPSFAQSKDVRHLGNGRAWMQQLRDMLAGFGIETSYFEGKPETYKKGDTVQMIVRLLGGKSMFPQLAGIGYAFSPERSARLNELLFWLNTNTTPDFHNEIIALRRADGSLLWDSLKSCESLNEEPVYDLEIEDERHLFVAGGMQVSNCIYGPRQFGIEDQGWLAWMMIAAITGRPITIYGDGRQVRDVLHVDDLLDAYDSAIERIDAAKGQIYNMGGGKRNVMAIWAEFGPILERLLGKKIEVAHANWRPGDQRVFYADIRKAGRDLGWAPKIDLEEGLEMMYEWVSANRDLFQLRNV